MSATLSDNSVEANKDDMRLLEAVLDDEQEMAVNRVIMAYTKGLMRWKVMDRAVAARDHRRALEVARGATAADRAKIIYCANASTGGPCMVESGAMVDAWAVKAAEALRELEGHGPDWSATAYPERHDVAAQRNFRAIPGQPSRASSGPISGRAPDGHHDKRYMADSSLCSQEQLNRLLDVTGKACHGCGKLSNGAKFNHCKTCKMAAYCGHECQLEHWRRAHRAECRKPVEFRSGDFVLLERSPAAVRSGDIMVARLVVAAGPGKWGAEVEDGQLQQVAEEHLRRLPPSVPPAPAA